MLPMVNLAGGLDSYRPLVAPPVQATVHGWVLRCCLSESGRNIRSHPPPAAQTSAPDLTYCPSISCFDVDVQQMVKAVGTFATLAALEVAAVLPSMVLVEWEGQERPCLEVVSEEVSVASSVWKDRPGLATGRPSPNPHPCKSVCVVQYSTVVVE